jgi:hypothetical protein
MTIRIEIRNVYGNETIYPVNEAAQTFAKIAGTKTLKPDTLRYAKTLGFSVEVVPNAAQVAAMAGAY